MCLSLELDAPFQIKSMFLFIENLFFFILLKHIKNVINKMKRIKILVIFEKLGDVFPCTYHFLKDPNHRVPVCSRHQLDQKLAFKIFFFSCIHMPILYDHYCMENAIMQNGFFWHGKFMA